MAFLYYTDNRTPETQQELHDCLQNEHAYICREPEWRADAIAQWEAIGGDRKFYEELFAEVDRRQ